MNHLETLCSDAENDVKQSGVHIMKTLSYHTLGASSTEEEATTVTFLSATYIMKKSVRNGLTFFREMKLGGSVYLVGFSHSLSRVPRVLIASTIVENGGSYSPLMAVFSLARDYYRSSEPRRLK